MIKLGPYLHIITQAKMSHEKQKKMSIMMNYLIKVGKNYGLVLKIAEKKIKGEQQKHQLKT